MKKKLRSKLPLIQLLHKSPPALRKSIINSVDNSDIHFISECVLQVLSGNQNISPACKEKLKKYKSVLRQLAAPPQEISYRRKRKLLNQKGGFLGIVLGSLLSGLLSKLTS